jgi:hypothetical protein
MKTDGGIVSARWLEEKPMIFKTDVGQAHSMHTTFVPGVGCTISTGAENCWRSCGLRR